MQIGPSSSNAGSHAASDARCYALVPCAGSGSRAGPGAPKQYRGVAGRAAVARTLQALGSVSDIVATMVVIGPDDDEFSRHVPNFEGEHRWIARCGGATRAETVSAGLGELASRGARPHDWVLVHDAARCLVRPEWIARLIDECRDDDVGGLLALPIADTIKQAADGRSLSTLDRADKWVAQTPQMFPLELLRKALAHAGATVTDEASAIEALGLSPKLVRGDVENFKLTWASDFELAERLFATRPARPQGSQGQR